MSISQNCFLGSLVMAVEGLVSPLAERKVGMISCPCCVCLHSVVHLYKKNAGGLYYDWPPIGRLIGMRYLVKSKDTREINDNSEGSIN
ncbi:hypothetical protein BDQ17DRAFT_1361146 [Cyathus striatus]|nr:hypothetical protein BDQ17DRAFT_1361146 [Cyathus striatus]